MGGLTRRQLVQAGALLAAGAPAHAEPPPFSADSVLRAAQDMAARPYQPPDTALPPAVEALTYEQYGSLRFRPERALWHGTGLPFQVSFFPRGFLYRPEVEVHEVQDGSAARVLSGPGVFEAADPAAAAAAAAAGDGLGFAGLRLHAGINAPGVFDEFCVFLGASYFRAVGAGLQYGLSARGLAVGTGGAAPELFPRFRTFWVERPRPDARTLVLHALLDGEDAAGAFRFRITPGATTVMEVASTLFPRRELADAGLAPLTSMYFFSGQDRARGDDWRPAVHDSDGLAVETAAGERLWRPLGNPGAVAHTAVAGGAAGDGVAGVAAPRGFGLLQRHRAFDDYGDLQVLYNRRPGAWVEPSGDWGAGAVELVELPTGTEYADNIVAFWRPHGPLPAGQPHRADYRLHWGADPAPASPLAQVVQARTGAGSRPGLRAFVLDLAGPALAALPPGAPTRLALGSTAGALQEGWSGPNPETGAWRVSLEFDPAGAAEAHLRCALLGAEGPLSETWLHRWTA